MNKIGKKSLAKILVLIFFFYLKVIISLFVIILS
jgi:hypothetical protein